MGRLLSQTAYAKEKEVSRQYINKLVKQGRIVLKQGKVDPFQADPVLRGEDVQGGNGSKPKEEGTLSYWDARAKKESYKAHQAKLEYEARAEQLLSRDQVLKAVADAGKVLRDLIMGQPKRLAPVLAAESNPAKVHAILKKENEAVLDEVGEALGRLPGSH